MLIFRNFIGLLILFLILSFTKVYSHTFQSSGKILASVKVQNPQAALLKLRMLGIDIAAVSKKEKVIDVVISDSEYKMLLSYGLDPVITMTKGVSWFGPDEEYKNPSEIEQILHDLHAKYPHLTKLVSIGKSLEGRDIWAMKISDNAQLDETATEPTLLFNGMHHAREVMTPEIVLDIAEFLLQGHGVDAKATKWVENLEIWVLPMFNVDGNNKMWVDDSMWRKNTRGGFGVDLNRNYPYGWNSCNGSSSNKRAQDYRGDAPASEPETQAMMSFIKNIRPAFNISYHSYSELVIYPYGCRPLRVETKEIVEGIGKDIAQKIGYTAGTAWELLYNADGGDIDWMYNELGVIPYVIEVNHRQQGFHPRYKKWRDKTVKKNRPGWQHLLDRALNSGVHGKIDFGDRDHSQIKVEVYLKGEKMMTYPVHTNGVYHLTLNPGTYTLKFVEGEELLSKIEVRLQNKLMNLEISSEE